MKKITLPWSKSITNRDFVLASLCDWVCEISWYLESDDTKYMLDALKYLWIEINEKNSNLIIKWWINKILGNNKEIYLHQSGTCMRFLTGLSILNKNGYIFLTWDERLLERPMWDLLDWIKQMWIKIESNNDFPPIKIFPSKITSNKIKMNWTSSSQYFTALLQVWAFIEWWLEIEVIWDLVSKPYIDLSIEELRKFWIKVENLNYEKFIIPNQKIINPNFLQIEWDASALSYIANYVVLENEKIEVTNIWNKSKQWDYKYLDILKKYFWLNLVLGENNTLLDLVKMDILDDWEYREIDFEEMPDVSMSFMSLAPLLYWKTKIIWLQTLNLKESNRIDAMWIELRKLWVNLEYDEKSITINKWFNPWKIVNIETYNDHRIAMVFGILKIYLEKKYDTKINILNPNCVSKTYPKFWEDLERITK